MKSLLKFALGVAALCVVDAAVAAPYPDRPIKVVVTTVPGPLDAFARVLMEQVGRQMNQSVVVENRPGAGGNVAADAVARSKPDGYTLLFALDTTFTVNPSLYKDMRFEAAKDFIPIALPVVYDQALAVNPAVPVNTVGEFVARARSQPMTYASGGNGSPSHLTMAAFLAAAGVKMSHVPYKGTGASIVDVMGGQVNALFAVESGILPYAKAGKLRELATSGTRRSQGAPDVPTIAESGYPGFEAQFAYVLMAPANTPREIVQQLVKEIDAAMKTAELQNFDRVNGYTATGLTQPQVQPWLDSARKRWADVIQKSNIVLD